MPKDAMNDTARPVEGSGAEKTGDDRKKFGISGAEELSALRGRIAELEADVSREADPGRRQETERELALERKRLELFLAERDSAGAFKFKRFGRRLRESFDDSPERRLVELDEETKEIRAGAAGERRRLLFVNMGELDRVNQEGAGHDAGNAALAETADVTERIVRETLFRDGAGDVGYELFRYSGNDFMLSLDDATDDEVRTIMERIEAQKPGGGIRGLSEPVPLTVAEVPFKEVVDLVHLVQTGLPPDERLADADEVNRAVVGMMKKRAEAGLEPRKFRQRVERLREKLKTEPPAQVKKFFDAYLAKGFQGSPVETFEDFQAWNKAMAEGEDVPSLDEMASQTMHKLLEIGRTRESLGESLVEKFVAELRASRPQRNPEAESGTVAAETAETASRAPTMTAGHAVMLEKLKAWRAAEEAGDAHAAALADLEYKIECAKRDGAIVETKPGRETEPPQYEFRGTGLLERGMHYEALEKSIKEGRDASVVFIDMGFLKYFNAGGRRTGDAAIRTAAQLMLDALKETGAEGDVYRYGGDEFTVQIAGGPEAAQEFMESLHVLEQANGPIGERQTDQETGEDTYLPTKLSFNSGYASMAEADQLFRDLSESGAFAPDGSADPETAANLKAEYMTTIADKMVEADKAISRFQLLIAMKREAAKESDPARRKDLQTRFGHLKKYSEKALFPKAGGTDKLDEWAASGKSQAELLPEIQTTVGRWKESAETENRAQRDLADELVGMRVEISDLRRQQKYLDEKDERQAALIRRLESRVKKIEEEKQGIIDARKLASGKQ